MKYSSPLGAILTIIFFFLPWVKCDNEIASGFKIARSDSLIWVIFIAAVLIIIIFYYFNNQKKLGKSIPFIVISSLIAIGIILYKYYEIKTDDYARYLKIEYGGIGAIAGLIISLIGSIFLKSEYHEDN